MGSALYTGGCPNADKGGGRHIYGVCEAIQNSITLP